MAQDKKELETITISLSKTLNKKMDEGAYNKSKLIDNLLTSYFNNLNEGLLTDDEKKELDKRVKRHKE